MLQGEHSAILLTFIKLPFVIKIFVLSIFEWPFYTGFTLLVIFQKGGGGWGPKPSPPLWIRTCEWSYFSWDINDNYKPDVSDYMVSVVTLEVVKKNGAMANSQILYLSCQ